MGSFRLAGRGLVLMLTASTVFVPTLLADDPAGCGNSTGLQFKIQWFACTTSTCTSATPLLGPAFVGQNVGLEASIEYVSGTCAFSGGTFTITTPDGIVHDVSSGGTLFNTLSSPATIVNSPDSLSTSCLFCTGPESGILFDGTEYTSAIVPYTVRSVDETTCSGFTCVQAMLNYTGSVAFTATPGPGPAGSSPVALTVDQASFTASKTCALTTANTDTFTTSVTVNNTDASGLTTLSCVISDGLVSLTPSPLPVGPGPGSSALAMGTFMSTATVTNQATVTCTPSLATMSLPALAPLTVSAQCTPALPLLTVVKTNSVAGVATVGTPFNWIITAMNSSLSTVGPAVFPAGSTVLLDNLPSTNITYGALLPPTTIPASTGTISCGISGFTITCLAGAGGAVLNPGFSFAVTVPATVSAPGTYTDPASTGVCEVDPGSVAKNPESGNTCSNTVVAFPPSLSAVKNNNVGGIATVGSPFNWAITIANAPPGPTVGAAFFPSGSTVFVDNLPSTNITYGALIGTTTFPAGVGTISCSISGFTITCTAVGNVTMAPGFSFLVTVPATVSAPGSYTDPASTGTCAVDPGSVAKTPESGNTCSNTVNAPPPSLSAVKNNNVGGIATIGVPFNWTIVIANASGPSVGAAFFPSGSTVFTDNLPSTNITYGPLALPTTIPATSGTISCSKTGFTISCVATGNVTMAPGFSFSVTVPATVSAAGSYTDPATTGICAVDPGSVAKNPESGNTCSNTVNTPPPILSAVKTNNVGGAATIGVPFTWTIAISNAPSAGAAFFPTGSTVFLDNLPSTNITYGSLQAPTTFTAGAGTISCSISGFTITCTAVGNVTMAPGFGFSVSVPATVSAGGSYTDPASTGVCEVDPGNVAVNPELNNMCSNTVTVPTMTGIKIKKVFGADAVPPGGTTTVTFTVLNLGATTLTGVTFTDTFPPDTTETTSTTATPCGPLSSFAVVGGSPGTAMLTGATIPPGGSCVVSASITVSAAVTPPVRVCDQTSPVTSAQSTGGPAYACLTIGTTPLAPPDAYQILYAANLNIGDSTINLTNTGGLAGVSPTGDICINAYVFDPAEEMIACCSCLVTPDGLNSFSVKLDLLNNPLTAAVPPSSVVVKLLANTPDPGQCNATPNFQNLVPGALAWGTTLEPTSPAGSFGAVQVKSKRELLSVAELNALVRTCGFVQQDGSGYGICNICRTGALTGAKLH